MVALDYLASTQVRRYGPQFMFTVSGVDSLEARLRAAQEELGVPPSDWVPVMYKAQSDTLCVIPTLSHFLCLSMFVCLLQCTGTGSPQHSPDPEDCLPFPLPSWVRLSRPGRQWS